MTDGEPAVGLELPTGTFDEATEWIGRTSETRFAPEPINGLMIRLYASVLEDGNPRFWNERYADRTVGGVTAPEGMLLIWKMPPLWTPGGDAGPAPIFGLDVPLPAEKDMLLFIGSESTFERPLFVGDLLNWQATFLDVSEEKETRLGTSHFVTSEARFHDQTGERVAESTSTIFRYERSGATVDREAPYAEGRRDVEAEPAASDRDRYRCLALEEVSAGDPVPSFQFPVPYEWVIRNVAATREFILPGLHDPEYARNQGNETIFLNAIALHGLMDRLATDLAAPAWHVVSRSMRILGSAVAGERLVVEGEVTAVEGGIISMEASIVERDGDPVCEGTVSIRRTAGEE
jgi:acyl dehydratase